VPLGASERIVEPLLREERERRGIREPLLLAHAYERVMPGPRYVDSIRNFWRSFAGIDAASTARAREFLSSFIDTASFPLRELASPTASEMAKLLENSYRAMNIAFIHEWTRLAEETGVNLFDVVESIRVRKGTHDNMRYPGFGVGGYCLTKDSYLAQWAANELFKCGVTLDMTLEALRINYRMPLHTLARLKEVAGGDLARRKVLVCGIAYLADVEDTRNSPAEVLVDELTRVGARVTAHDPCVRRWDERRAVPLAADLDAALADADAIVLTVPHRAYLALNADTLLSKARKCSAIVDAQNILSDETAAKLRRAGWRVAGVGKGHWRTAGYHLISRPRSES
jgi:nucleotide sugar dehydrogenase